MSRVAPEARQERPSNRICANSVGVLDVDVSGYATSIVQGQYRMVLREVGIDGSLAKLLIVLEGGSEVVDVWDAGLCSDILDKYMRTKLVVE